MMVREGKEAMIPCPPGFSDHVYKKVHSVDVPLRLWPAPTTKGKSKKAPWLFWVHGGGFQAGKHFRPNWWINPGFAGRGYHVVSVAYRLMPQISIDKQANDLVDAYTWCLKNLPQIVGEGNIDLPSYVVGGDSAGGTFSTLMGHMLDPKPKCVLDLYGPVDFGDGHYNKPKPKAFGKVYSRPEEEVKKAVEDRDPSHANTTIAYPNEWPPEISEDNLKMLWGTDYVVGERDHLAADVMTYINKNGLMLKVGFSRENFENDEDWFKWVKSMSPYRMLRKVPKYPPTFLMHGTADEAVPIAQSYKMATKLRELGVPVGESYMEGGGHEFEGHIYDPKDPDWQKYIEPALDFIDKHVKGEQSAGSCTIA